MARLDKYGRVVFANKVEILNAIGSTQNEDGTWTPAISGRGLVNHLTAFDMEDNTKVSVGVETPDLDIMEEIGLYDPEVVASFEAMAIAMHEGVVSQEYKDAYDLKYNTVIPL